MKPPSFEPWLARIRLVRAWLAVVGFVLVSMVSYTNGVPADEAILRGIVVALICYFVGWASALWVFSELYGLQIGKLRAVAEEHERRKREQLQELYNQRIEALQGGGDAIDQPLSPLSPPPAQRGTAQAPRGTGRKAA